MCGIVGSHGRIDSGVAERMLGRLDHRGPVGEGSAMVSGNWLGHRRCTIADVEDGKQPLVTESGDLHLVGDAEIYNEDELRETLADVQLRAQANNEVALHLFNEKGNDAFAELHGKFAFVIAGEDGRFVAARDPVGMKPLYLAERDGTALFASEISVFDEEWLPHVDVFPPGHYWTPEGGLEQFATAITRDTKKADEFASPSRPGAEIPEDLLRRVREQLVESVENQLTYDVRIGAFLSGGLDSSLVAAIAARWYGQRGEKLKTFAVGLGDAPDVHAARIVAEYLGTEHHERIYTVDDAVEALPDVVRFLENFDPSLVRSSVPNYMVAELAARHVDAVLIGEGGDELFGGYEHLEDFDDEEELQSELIRSFEEGHNGGLQRVDRMTMGNGLEALIPFLDQEMIDLAFSIPAGWKFIGEGQPEKRILRQAFDGWLPDDILWRKKAQFGEGSGAVTFFTQKMEETVTDEELARERNKVDPPLRSREEVAYYRIFAEHLPGVRPEQTISRFVTL